MSSPLTKSYGVEEIRVGDRSVPLGSEENITIQEDLKEFRIRIDLPGFEKGDLTVTTHNGHLVISGLKKRPFKTISADEQKYTTYTKTLLIPPSVDADKVSAEYRYDGLVINLPKGIGDNERPQTVNIS